MQLPLKFLVVMDRSKTFLNWAIVTLTSQLGNRVQVSLTCSD